MDLSRCWADIEDCLDQAERKLSNNPGRAELASGLEWLQDARDAEGQLKSFDGASEFLSQYTQRLGAVDAMHKAAQLAFEADDTADDMMLHLRNAERKFKQGPPKSWWDEAMEDLDQAEEVISKLREPKFTDIKEAVEAIATFVARATALRSEYACKVLGDEVDDLQREVRSKLNSAESMFKKGPPKSWWDDAMEELEKAEEPMNQLCDEKYSCLSSVAECMEGFKVRVADLRQKYVENVVMNEVDGEIRSLKSILDNAEYKMKKALPMSWAEEALEELEKAAGALSRLQEAKYKEIPAVKKALDNYVERSEKLKASYTLLAMNDLVKKGLYEMKSSIDAAVSFLNKGRCWATEAMQKLEEAEEHRAKMLDPKFEGVDSVKEALESFATKATTVRNGAMAFVLEKEAEDSMWTFNLKWDNAQRKIKQGSKQWWDEAMEDLDEATEALKPLFDPKYYPVQKVQDTLRNFKIKSRAMKSDYAEKIAADSLKTLIYDVNCCLRDAETKMAKAPQHLQWAEEGLEHLEQAIRTADPLFHPKYDRNPDAQATRTMLQEKEQKLRADFVEHYAKRKSSELLHEMKGKLNEAEQHMTHGDPHWWDVALDSLEEAELKASELRAEMFDTLTEVVTARDDYKQRAAVVRSTFAVKRTERDLSDTVYELNSVLGTAESKMSKAPPVSWAEEAMEELEKAEEHVVTLRSPKFEGMAEKNEALQQHTERTQALQATFEEQVLSGEFRSINEDLRGNLHMAEDKFAKGPPKSWWDEALVELEKADGAVKKLATSRFKGYLPAAEAVRDYKLRSSKIRDNYSSKVLTDEFIDKTREMKSALSSAESMMSKAPPVSWAEDAMVELEHASEHLTTLRDAKFLDQPSLGSTFEEFHRRSEDLKKQYHEMVVKTQIESQVSDVTNELRTAEDKFKKGPPASWWDEAMEHLDAADDLAEKKLFSSKFAGDERVLAFKTDFVNRAATLRISYGIKTLENSLKDSITEVQNLLRDAETTFAKGPPRSWHDEAMQKLQEAKEVFASRLQTESKFHNQALYAAFVKEMEERTAGLLMKYREQTLIIDAEEALSEITNKLSETDRNMSDTLYDDGMAGMQATEGLVSALRLKTRFLGVPCIQTFLSSWDERRDNVYTLYNDATLGVAVHNAVYTCRSKLREAQGDFKKGPPVAWWNQGMEKLSEVGELIAEQFTEQRVKEHPDTKAFLKEYEDAKQQMTASYFTNVTINDLNTHIYSIKDLLAAATSCMKRGPPVEFFDDALAKVAEAQQQYAQMCNDTRFIGKQELLSFQDTYGKQVEALQKEYITKTLQDAVQAITRDLSTALSNAEARMKQGPPRQFYDEAMEFLQAAASHSEELQCNPQFVDIPEVAAALSDYTVRKGQLEKCYIDATCKDEANEVVHQVEGSLKSAEYLFAKYPPVEWLDEGMMLMWTAIDDAKLLFQDGDTTCGKVCAKYSTLCNVAEFCTNFASRVQIMKDTYKEKVAADVLKKIQEEADGHLKSAVSNFEKQVYDVCCDELEKGEGVICRLESDRKFEGDTAAVDFVKDWKARSGDFRTKLATKLTGDEADKLIRKGRAYLAQLSDETHKTLAAAALQNAKDVIASLGKQPLMLMLEDTPKYLQEVEEAESVFAKRFLEHDVQTTVNAVNTLLETATAYMGGLKKKECEDLFNNALDISKCLLEASSLHRKLPLAVSCAERLQNLGTRWFKRDITAEVNVVTTEGQGSSAPSKKDGKSVIAFVRNFCDFHETKAPELQSVDITPDIKASLFKYLRKYNDEVSTINKEVKAAVKIVNKINYEKALSGGIGMGAFQIETALYPVQTVESMCKNMTVDGPSRTLQQMKDTAPEYPLVIELWEGYDKFRKMWTNMKHFWKTLDKMSNDLGSLMMMSIFAQKQSKSFSKVGTCPCKHDVHFGSNISHVADYEAWDYIFRLENRARTSIDIMKGTYKCEDFPGKEECEKMWDATHEDAIIRHVRHCVEQMCIHHMDIKNAKLYQKALQKYPKAYAEAMRRWAEMTENRYNHDRACRKEESKKFVMQDLDVIESSDDPDVWVPTAVPIKLGPNSGVAARSSKVDTNDTKQFHHKIVFSKNVIHQQPNKKEEAGFADAFTYGDTIHGRAFWDLPLSCYAVGVTNDEKKNPVYGEDKITSKHVLEMLVFGYINGKQIVKPGEPDGALGYFDFRKGGKTNWWTQQTTVKVWAQRPDATILDNSPDDWELASQRLNRKLFDTGAGTHTVRLEVCYRIVQRDENYEHHKLSSPVFNTPVSHPLAAGEFKITVPESATMFNPLPVTESPLGVDEVGAVMQWLQRASDWGGRGRMKEVPVHVALKGDWFVASTARTVVELGYNKVKIVEEPAQYGVQCWAVFYRSPESGWSKEELVAFDLTAVTTSHRGLTKGDPPSKAFPPVAGVFVGGNTTCEPFLLPDSVLADIRRCKESLRTDY